MKILIQNPSKKLFKKEVEIPGSKYIANRLLIMASLGNRVINLKNLPNNRDIEVARTGLKELGVQIKPSNRELTDFSITGIENQITAGLGSKPLPKIYTHESGTFSRFIISLAGLFRQPITITASPSMMSRPMESLCTALVHLGAKIKFLQQKNHLPLEIEGTLKGGKVQIPGQISSQYLSSLLMTLPLVHEDSEIELSSDLVSKSYVDLTVDLLRQFNIRISVDQDHPERPSYFIPGRQRYDLKSEIFEIKADPVTSTYFLALGALTDQPIEIKNFDFSGLQGETDFYKIMERMGCVFELDRTNQTIKFLKLNQPNQLNGIEADMSSMPDAVPTLCVLAAFAKGETRIKNIAHLRFKESNRVEDMAQELTKIGVKVVTAKNHILIRGNPNFDATKTRGDACILKPHNDHRLAMSLALLASKSSEKIILEDPNCIDKSFPQFFHQLKELGFSIHDY